VQRFLDPLQRHLAAQLLILTHEHFAQAAPGVEAHRTVTCVLGKCSRGRGVLIAFGQMRVRLFDVKTGAVPRGLLLSWRCGGQEAERLGNSPGLRGESVQILLQPWLLAPLQAIHQLDWKQLTQQGRTRRLCQVAD